MAGYDYSLVLKMEAPGRYPLRLGLAKQQRRREAMAWAVYSTQPFWRTKIGRLVLPNHVFTKLYNLK